MREFPPDLIALGISGDFSGTGTSAFPRVQSERIRIPHEKRCNSFLYNHVLTAYSDRWVVLVDALKSLRAAIARSLFPADASSARSQSSKTTAPENWRTQNAEPRISKYRTQSRAVGFGRHRFWLDFGWANVVQTA